MAQVGRNLCACIGSGYSDCGNFSCGGAPFFGGVSVAHMRIRLPLQVRKEENMKIVVLNSPKWCRGILRKLLGLHKE